MSNETICSDGELIALYARENSHSAFAELVARYIDLVYATALRQLRDSHLAQDVTQDVFIVLARRCASMNNRVPLPVWLYQTACHASRNVMKAAQRRRHYEMAARESATQTVQPPVDPWNEAMPLLDEAVQSLNETDRSAVILRYFQGQSLQEVGAVLGVSVNATSKRLERIVEKLRRFFHRRKVVIGSAALVSSLAAAGATAAPPHLAGSVTAGAISSGSAAVAIGSGVAGKGVGMLISLTKYKVIAACILLMLTAGGVALVMKAKARRWSDEATHDALAVSDTQLALAPPGETGTPIPGPGQKKPAPEPKGNFPDYVRGGRIPVLSSIRFKVPRVVRATIQAEHYDMQQGVQIDAPGLTSLDEGDFVRYSEMDFGKGGAVRLIARVAVPKEEAGKKIEARVDDPAGLVIATLTVADTGGWGKWAVQSTPITEDLGGVHDVYLTFAGGKNVANLDWIKFGGGERDALARIETESYDDALGVQDQGRFISNFDTDDYLRYNQVNFGKESPGWFHAMCGCRKQYAGGKVQVRLDRFDGKVIAEITVRDTGSHSKHEIHSVQMTPVTGVHDIFVVARNDAVCDLDWMTFSKTGKVEADDVPDGARAQPQGPAGAPPPPIKAIGQ